MGELERDAEDWDDSPAPDLGPWKRYLAEPHHRVNLSLLLDVGVPDVLRGQAWKLFTRSHVRTDLRTFEEILQSSFVDYDAHHAIDKDISRTFPRHALFETAEGKQQLSSVLVAYATVDQQVGYCQGMGFIAAFLLCYMKPGDAFGVLLAVMQNKEYNLRALFLPGMPNFQPVMQELGRFIDILLPLVAAKLARCDMDCTIFASQWFLTLFVYNMPFEFVARVWDLFFVKSWAAIYRVAVALVDLIADELLLDRNSDMESISLVFKSLPSRLELPGAVSRLLHRAMQLNLDEGDIRTFRT